MPAKRPDLDSTETGSKEVANDAATFSGPSSSVVTNDESDSEADSAPKSQDDLSALLSHLEARLLDAFNQKLAFDNFKEKQIDRLHEELQGYKSDLLLKAAQPLIAAMIKLHADAGRLIIGISQEDPTKLTAERIIGFFDNFRDEIADLLAVRGVEMYLTALGDLFDARRQSSIGTVETSNSALADALPRPRNPDLSRVDRAEQGEGQDLLSRLLRC